MWAVFHFFFFKFLKFEIEVTYHTILILGIQFNDLICLNTALVNIPVLVTFKYTIEHF